MAVLLLLQESRGGEPPSLAGEASCHPVLLFVYGRQFLLWHYRKALEAKKGLEEAFRAMESDDAGESPIGIPLKNPRTKTLKGGLMIKDT